MEKFNFTDPGNCICGCNSKLITSVYGVRNVGEGKEELSIIVFLSTTEPAKVVYLRYKNGELIGREVEAFTETMELGKKIRRYIDKLKG